MAWKARPGLSSDPDKVPSREICQNCGEMLFVHCTAHAVPCCPGNCPVR